MAMVMVTGILGSPAPGMAQSTGTSAPVSSTRVDDTAVALRNYAFARCVALGFSDNETVRADAETASRAYAASAKASDAAIHQQMDAHAESWLTLPYKNFRTGRRLNVLACIDFQQSADMTTLPVDYPVPGYDAATQLRNFALASCVAQGFDDEIARDDARTAASAYIEFGDNDLDDFRHIGEFVSERRKQLDPASSSNASHIVTCMDIYRGAALMQAIEGLLEVS